MPKILITDDHALIRLGLKQILIDGLGSVTVGEAGTAREAVDLVMKEKWDVVVMDITMPGRSGLDALRDIKLASPQLPVLVLSMHGEDQLAIRVLRAGAAGFVTKESAPEELVKAIRKVLEGGRYVSSALAEKLAADLSKDNGKAPHEKLSDREYQVMCMIASGKSPTQIAENLALSIKTVSTYRARIMEKTGMQTNAELTHYSIKNQLVT